MSVTQQDMQLIIRGQNAASAAIDAVGRSLASLEQQVGKSAGGFLHLSGAIAAGNVAAAGIIGTIGKVTGVFTGGLSASTNFGQSMANIRSVLTEADAGEFSGQIQDLALQLGKELPLSAGEAAAGMEALAKKGISAADILSGAGRSIAELASVTGEDLAAGATVAAAAVNTFGLSGQQVAGVTNLMAGAVLRGGTTVSQFGQGLAQAGTTVASFGGTIQDVTIALGVMAKAGVQGSDAGTSLKTMYQNLIPTTKAAIDAQRALGLVTADGASAFIDATGKVKPYEEVARILAEATKDLSQAQRAQALETIFGTDAVRAAAIAADLGAGKFGAFADAIRSVDAGGAAKARLDSLAGDMQNLSGSVETLQISLGQKLEPAFRGMAQAANAGVDALIDATKELDFSGVVAPIREAFDAAGKFIADGGSITGAVEVLIQRLSAFAQSMFGAGFTLISTFAQGMVSGVSAIFQAVSAVAEAIASFLVGSSPPPSGPLSNIDQDGRTLIETYAAGMGEASLGAVEDIAARVQATLSDFKGLESIGTDVEAQIRLISDAMEEVSRASQDVGFQIQDIKSGFEDQLTPLKDQLEAIDNVNDSLNKQLDIVDEIAGLNLKAAEAAAKGDPAKRAEIAGKQEANRFAQDSLQLQLRQLELENQKGKDGTGSNDKAIASAKAALLKLDQEELGLKRDLAAQTDRTKLAEIAKAKTALDLSGDARKIEERKADLQRELLKIPIEQHIKDINRAQQDQLRPLEAQQKILERQSAALARQRQDWQGLAADIKRAADAVKPEKAGAGGGGGGGAGGVKLPGLAAGGTKLPNLGDTLLKAADEAQGKAAAAGQKLATNVMESLQNFFASNGPKLIGGALGALVGGIALGPIGVLIGGSLGAAIGEGIGKAIPDIGKLVQEKISVAVFAVEAFGKILQGQDAYIIPFQEALKSLIPAPFQSMVANAGQTIATLRDAFLAVVQVLQGQWSPGIDQASSGIDPFVRNVGLAATWLKNEFFPAATEAATVLSGALKTAVSWLSDTGWPALVTAGQAVGAKVGEIKQFFSDLFVELQKKGVFTDLETTWKNLGDIANILGKNLSESVNPSLHETALQAEGAGTPVERLATNIATTSKNLNDGVAALKAFAEWCDTSGKRAVDLATAISGITGGNTLEGLRALGRLLGRDFSGSVATGLGEGAPALQSAAFQAAGEVPQTWRDAWEMHSPSKVGVDIGLQFASSVAMGIAQGDGAIAESVLAITKAAIANGIDPLIALALAKTESGFNAKAVGDNGHSVGLFQLHDQGQGAGLGASRADPWVNASKFLGSHGELFKQLKASGLAGRELAVEFGRLAEVCDPRFAIRYGQAYEELVAQFGAAGPVIGTVTQGQAALASVQQQGITWAQQMAEEQQGLTNTLSQQAPAGRAATDAMAAFRDVLGPIERQVAGSAISADTLRFKLLELAKATGVNSSAWDAFASGALDSSSAMSELIAATASLGPEFAAVAEYEKSAGASSNEAALRWLQAAKHYQEAKAAVAADPTLTAAVPAAAANSVTAVATNWDTVKASADTATESIRSYQTVVQGIDPSKINEQKAAWDSNTESVTKLYDAAKSLGDYLDGHTFKFHVELPDLPDWAIPGSPMPLETAMWGLHKSMRAVSQVTAPTLRNLSSPLTVGRVPTIAPSGGGGGSINVAPGAITVNETSNPDATARAVKDALIKHGRRNGGRSGVT